MYSVVTGGRKARKIYIKMVKSIKSINKRKNLILVFGIIFVILLGNNIYMNIEKDLRINFLDVGQRRLYSNSKPSK